MAQRQRECRRGPRDSLEGMTNNRYGQHSSILEEAWLKKNIGQSSISKESNILLPFFVLTLIT